MKNETHAHLSESDVKETLGKKRKTITKIGSLKNLHSQVPTSEILVIDHQFIVLGHSNFCRHDQVSSPYRLGFIKLD